MFVSYRSFPTAALAVSVCTIALAYPSPEYCRDDKNAIKSALKENQEQFDEAHFDKFCILQEDTHKSDHKAMDSKAWGTIKKVALADGSFTGLLATYRGQLVVYMDLLDLYETCRVAANADPSDQTKKDNLEAAKASRNLVYDGMKKTYSALAQRYKAVRANVKF